MKMYFDLVEVEITPKPCVISLGFFDGMHRGHMFLLSRVQQEAANRDAHTVIITFSSLPKVGQKQIITTLDKRQLLEASGVDILVELDFSQVSTLSPHDFLSLVRAMFPQAFWVIGEDCRFGAGRSAGSEFLESMFKGRVRVVEPIEREELSSTYIRQCIEAGDLEKASSLLGRPLQKPPGRPLQTEGVVVECCQYL